MSTQQTIRFVKKATVIALGLMVLVVGYFVPSSKVLATQPFLSDYTYRRLIDITGSTGGAQTNYAVKINVTYDSDMQTDFDDIRFTSSDGTTLLDHWRESYTASTSAVFWVEIPSIPASPDTVSIYMYYGNAAASSASNADNTFVFFDDFETGNMNKWSSISAPSAGDSVGASTADKKGGSYSARVVEDGIGGDHAGFRKDQSFPVTPLMLDFWFRATAATKTGPHWEFYESAKPWSTQWAGGTSIIWGHKDDADRMQYYNGAWKSYLTGAVGTTWHHYQGIFQFTTGANFPGKLYQDGTLQVTEASRINDATISSAINYLRFISWSGSAGAQTWYVDDIVVRRYVDPEPLVGSPGPEETSGAPVNNPPVADSKTVTTNEDTPLSITLTGSDPDGDPLTYAVVTPPTKGTLSGTGASRTYTPNLNFNGPDSFTYKANDGSLDSNIATVSITVTPVNDAPVADSKTVSTTKNTPVVITLTGSDVDGDPLTYTVVTPPTKGTLSGTGASRTYTPKTDYTGSDSFTYKANDGSLDSNIATVSITVNPPSGEVTSLEESKAGYDSRVDAVMSAWSAISIPAWQAGEEKDLVVVLAKLAKNVGIAEVNYHLENNLAIGTDSDFYATWLIRLYYLYKDDPRLTQAAKDNVLQFIEDITERTVPNQTHYGSENHWFQEQSNAYLYHQLVGSDLSGYRYYLLEALHRKVKYDFAEINSPGYQGVSLRAILNLYDFAADPVVKKAAEVTLDFIWTNYAVQSLDRMRGGPYGRSWHVDWDEEMGHTWDGLYWSSLIWLGNGDQTVRVLEYLVRPKGGGTPVPCTDFDAQAVLAATSEYRIPDVVVDLAVDRVGRAPFVYKGFHKGALPIEGSGQWSEANAYHYYYQTSHYLLASGAVTGFRDMVRWDIVFETNPLAYVKGYNEKDAAAQYKNVVVFGGGGVRFSSDIDEKVEEGGITFFREGGTFGAARNNIVDMGLASDYSNSFASWKTHIKTNTSLSGNTYVSSEGDVITFTTDPITIVKVNGVAYTPYTDWKFMDSPYVTSDQNSAHIEVRKGGRVLILDFADPGNPIKNEQ